MTTTPATLPREPLANERTVGWALLGLTLVTAGGLIATAWQGYVAVGEASRALVLGQGNELISDVRAPLRDSQARPPRTEDLRAILSEEQQEHPELRYVVALDPLTGETSEAGESGLGRERVLELMRQAGKRRQLLFEGGRAVLVRRLPPNAAQRAAHKGEKLISREKLNRIAIEFVPGSALELQATARRTILIGASAALLLVLTSIAFVRLLRHRAELERRVARDRHLAALGEMSAVLAHEIRNPLASLKGHAQLLAEGFEEESRERKKVDRIVGEAVRLQELSSDLLDFVKSAEIDPSPTEVAALLQGCLDAVEGRVELDAASAPARWNLDSVRLQRVIVNLLTNAQQAQQASGSEAPVVLRAAAEGKELVISVLDQGDGLTAGAEERIFEPFHTTRTRGTGLGLAVARRIVELHGGEVTGESRPEGGSVFTVRLPTRRA